jgi:hypothetical protein
MKRLLIAFAISIGALALIFALGVYGLGWNKFFMPRQENIRRETFEHTQSYVQGATQDLAVYFDQYAKATTQEDKETIRQVVVMRFSNLDASLIDNAGLRQFLTNMRGF